MARYTGPVCRLCRREGTKLFLKGTRCLTEKCAVERRAYAPGQHGQSTGRRRKASEYAKQLREKQKVKRIYGLSERQFVRHRHILVNGRVLDIPSYRVRIGEEVRVADASRELVQVKLALEQFGRGQPVSWIQVDTDKVLGKVTERPTRDAIPLAAQEQLIVELYSK